MAQTTVLVQKAEAAKQRICLHHIPDPDATASSPSDQHHPEDKLHPVPENCSLHALQALTLGKLFKLTTASVWCLL